MYIYENQAQEKNWNISERIKLNQAISGDRDLVLCSKCLLLEPHTKAK